MLNKQTKYIIFLELLNAIHTQDFFLYMIMDLSINGLRTEGQFKYVYTTDPQHRAKLM